MSPHIDSGFQVYDLFFKYSLRRKEGSTFCVDFIFPSQLVCIQYILTEKLGWEFDILQMLPVSNIQFPLSPEVNDRQTNRLQICTEAQ